MPIALPWNIFAPLAQLLWLFSAPAGGKAEDGDDAADEDADDDTLEDDLNDEFGEDDDFGGKKKDGDDEEKSGKDKDDKSKDGKKDSSAIHQKLKLKEKLRVANDRIAALEAGKKDDGKGNSEEENKAKAARDWLRQEIKRIEEEDESKIDLEVDAIEEEIEEILDENDDLTEDQILEVMEEYEGATPAQAVKFIRALEKASKGSKPKPKIPSPSDTSDRVRDDGKKDDKDKKGPKTLDDVGRAIKERLGLGRRK